MRAPSDRKSSSPPARMSSAAAMYRTVTLAQRPQQATLAFGGGEVGRVRARFGMVNARDDRCCGALVSEEFEANGRGAAAGELGIARHRDAAADHVSKDLRPDA